MNDAPHRIAVAGTSARKPSARNQAWCGTIVGRAARGYDHTGHVERNHAHWGPPVGVLGSLFDAGARVTSIPMRGTVALIDAGIEAEQRTRAALSAAAGRMALDLLDAVLAGDAVERVLERVEATGVAQRIAARIIEDGIAEQIVTLLLESEELWVLVDEIARSPSVTEAITHQSAGFVDQITDTVRDRSRDADTWVQGAARRFGRRRKGGDASRLTPLPDGK